ncbi:class I SAM-dependent methyltransferase [Crossiella equi]|uniref:class I SAM-dependent methyltransferase n=1 Tax=Crossiella equi TaxID=130796 RepID=UPI001302D840|nr:class I SAM-dependent methyltransferase [Crossiella equi]
MDAAVGSEEAKGRYRDELGTDHPLEPARLRALTDAFDPGTRRRIEALGLDADWSSLDVGAGTGSVSHWLAARCPEGRVTATELDPSLVAGPLPPNLAVLRHDITAEDFPDGSFQLIVARMVLMHLPQRQRIVERMYRWLAPGGVLLLEELVHFPRHGLPEESPFRRAVDGWWAMLSASFGMDADWGGRAAQALCRAGYVDVRAEAELPVVHAGTSMARFSRLTLEIIASRLVASGFLDEEELRRGLEEIDDPSHFSFPMALIATSGYRSMPA